MQVVQQVLESICYITINNDCLLYRKFNWEDFSKRYEAAILKNERMGRTNRATTNTSAPLLKKNKKSGKRNRFLILVNN
jgi:hypothetical protein